MSPPPIWTTSARWSARCRATRNCNGGFVMPRFAANLTMLFTDRPFLERFDAAVRNGFRAVEYMFPYQEDTDGIARVLERLKLEQVLFNLPAGDWGAGDRGVAVHPGRRDEFRRGVAQAVDLALRYRCRRVNCLVGKRDERLAYEEQWRCLVDNLRYAAGQGRRMASCCWWNRSTPMISGVSSCRPRRRRCDCWTTSVRRTSRFSTTFTTCSAWRETWSIPWRA